jgi:RNA polymerase sigma-70 factor, ECF subfamily
MTVGGADTVFEEVRSSLLGASYRILGSWSDAEDVVQETWLKWLHHHDDVAHPRAWLTKVTVRASIDSLRMRQSRREEYPGEWLPEPVSLLPGPGDVTQQRDDVSIGVLLMMEVLSPLERAVFVLREAFGWPYSEIADILDRSEAAVRQLDHRARAHLREGSDRFVADDGAVRSATERFLAACVGGSIETMLDVLAPGVVLHSDGGGEAKAPLRRMASADKVARFMHAIVNGPFSQGNVQVEWVDVNGHPGLLTSMDGAPVSVVTVDVDAQGRIASIYLMAAPSKLTRVRPLECRAQASPVRRPRPPDARGPAGPPR